MSESDRGEFVSAVRRTAWTVGEFVHRRLFNGNGNSDGNGELSGTTEPFPEPATSGATVPTYPYVRTDRYPLRTRPPSSVTNPVLTAADVSDYGNVDFLADPFLFPAEDGWHLFFEVFNRDRRPTGVIGHAATTDGRSWHYDRVVLRSEVHLAFPYVFKWDGEFYMIPDRWNRETPAAIQLYRTDSLPDGWRPVSTVVSPDQQLADCVVFRWDDLWWAMLGTDDDSHELHVYHADDLLDDEWTPHERNPVVTGRPEAARPAGRPIVREDRILVFFQDCAAQYGDKVRAFEVERLSRSEYADRERPESPILEAADGRLGWNTGRMHHIDPWYTSDGWWCAVDGNVGFGQRAFGPDHWSIGLYRA